MSIQAPGIRSYSNNDGLVQERRQHIMACAIKVFLRKGYRGATIREIAQACGMSEGAIYRYIGSKNDLLHLICVNRARSTEGLQKVLDEAGDVSVSEALRACLRYHFVVGDVSRDYNLFFNREIRNFSSEDRQILLESQVAVLRFFERLLEEGIGTGEFHAKSPLLMAHNILMVGHDWGLRRWFLTQHFTLEEYTEMQTELILRQLGTGDVKMASDGTGEQTRASDSLAP